VKEKRKFQFSLLHYSQSSRDKNCSSADEVIWFVSRANEKDDAFSHQKLMFTIWNIREVQSFKLFIPKTMKMVILLNVIP